MQLSSTTHDEEQQYRDFYHDVAATYYIAHKNIKSYKILYPLCVAAHLGMMAAVCASPAPAPVKVASLIFFPLCAATLAQKKEQAIHVAKQAKAECDDLLSRFKNFNQIPHTTEPFKTEYPAMYAQSKTIRGLLIRKTSSGNLLLRYWADFGYDLWAEKQRIKE